VGLDFSQELLRVAKSGVKNSKFMFMQADLTSAGWSEQLVAGFDFVFAFATLHHIPSHELRRDIVRRVRAVLDPREGGSETRPYKGGAFILSAWQFLNSERLRERIQPWGGIGLSAADVDEGDYLLDWRSGGKGFRYVHYFDETELADLAAEAGFSVRESFHSDGESRDLAVYQIWSIV
jgi:SAM-dependent methyltransferase